MTRARLRKGGWFWQTPGLVLICMVVLALPVRAQDNAPARVPCDAVHALNENALQTWISRVKKEGYRPTHLSAYSSGPAPQFAAVAIKDGKNYLWEARQGLTEPQYRQAYDELNKKGYRPISVAGYMQNNAVHFAGLWVKDGVTGWVARHGLTEVQYRQAYDELNKTGHWPISVSGYLEGNVTRFAAVWVTDKAKVWVARHHLTEAQYRQVYDEFRPKGYRPESISAYLVGNETRFATVFVKGAKDYWEARHNLTQAQYQAEFERWGKQGGRPLLVCGYPLGKETRYAAVLVGDTATGHALVGQWSAVTPWPVVAIDSTLLPNGKVLVWPRLEDDGDNHGDPKAKPKPKNRDPAISYPHLWDPATGQLTLTPRPPYNLFCSGHAFLPDGRLLVAGGHIWANFWGDGRAAIYDSAQNSWTRVADMNNRRWYPSCVTLASGEVLVLGGTFADGEFNHLPQVFQAKSGTWRNLNGAQDQDNKPLVPYYPFLHVAPNGKVFKAGPNRKTWYLNTSGNGEWTPVGDRVFERDRDYGSSVMYEPGRVLVMGGSFPPTETAEVIDLNKTPPSWHSIEPMWSRRRHMNATLLPDGTVFVSGGTATSNMILKDAKTGKLAPSLNDATGAVLNTELWDPHTGHWFPMAAQSVPRLYHSTALLLPDGRVLSAGGGEPGADTPKGFDVDYRNAQIFSPPYLFRGPRPVISSAPQTVAYGHTFEVKTPDAAHIHTVKWIRLGSATHARNFNQRINHLLSKAQGASLTVTAPANANLAPPGHYLLFILNDKGVPSVAKIIHIG